MFIDTLVRMKGDREGKVGKIILFHRENAKVHWNYEENDVYPETSWISCAELEEV